MTSGYPGAIDTSLSPAGKSNTTTMRDDHPGHHNLLADAIEKIQIELGVNPSGSAVDVVARLDASEAVAVILAPAASARNVIQPTGPTVIPLIVKGAASQSAALQEWFLNPADAQPWLRAGADGKLMFGTGGSSAPVSDLFYSGGSTLRTSGHFVTNGNHYIDTAGSGFKLFFGSSFDVSIYRNGADQLRTDDLLVITRPATTDLAHYVSLPADSQARFVIFADGKIQWGPGNAVVDTSLYRAYANALRTDGEFIGGSHVYVDFANSGASLWFGSAFDAGIIRSAASTLGVSSSLNINRNLSDAAQTPLSLNVNGTLKQVLVGAADSGGSGFKMLRIAN